MLIEEYIMQRCKQSNVFLFDLTQKCITGSSRLRRSYPWTGLFLKLTDIFSTFFTSFVICRGLILSLIPPRVLCWNLFYFLYMMHHAVPQGTALCSAILRPPEVKSCRIIWCVVQREHIVENRCDLLGFKCFQRLLSTCMPYMFYTKELLNILLCIRPPNIW